MNQRLFAGADRSDESVVNLRGDLYFLGVALYELDEADNALCKAKEEGQNRVVLGQIFQFDILWKNEWGPDLDL